MGALTGRIALVTGGSRGIGQAVAVALAREGADVAVNYRSRDAEAHEVQREVEALGRRCLLARADVSQGAEVTRMVDSVTRGLGDVGILVNNAGIVRPQPLEDIREEDWDELLAPEGITANAVAPALIATEMIASNPRARPELIPLRRFGTPEETAEVVVMLARNGYVTGQTLNVNGGMAMS